MVTVARAGDLLTPREARIVNAVAPAKEALEKAEAARAEALRGYAKRRPLTVREHRALVEHVASNGALCCKDGLAWLRTKVPEIWAKAINSWAWEALGCKMPSEKDEHVRRVQALARDVLPGGYD